MLKKIISTLLALVMLSSVLVFAPCAEVNAAADGVGYYRIQTTEGNLRIRKSASTGAEQVGSIPSGVVVYVSEIAGSWGKTTYNGVTGWIFLDYAVKTDDTTSPGYATTEAKSILARLAELRKKFPNGKYWNHYGSSEKNLDGWTDTPCPSSGYAHSSTKYCNGQCDGFARKLGLDLFGESTYSDKWESASFNINTLCVGDIFRYNGKHTVMVIGFTESTDTLIIADCNWNCNCNIRWDASFSISRYVRSVDFVRHFKGNTYNRALYLNRAATSATLDHTTCTLPVGASLTLKATLKPDYPNLTYEWSSSDKSVATVDSSGKIRAVAVGTAKISVVSGTAKATCTVTVTGYATVSRIFGDDRVATSIAASRAGWQSGAENVILANGFSFADALAGVPLSAALDAPILLTANGKSGLETAVLNQLTSLGAKNIYILGGDGVVSAAQATTLSGKGYAVTRLAGDTRFETSVRIAEKVAELSGGSKKAYFANGFNFPDALSAGSVAALEGSPILYTREDGSIDAATAKYLTDSGCNQAAVIGGTGVVGDGIKFNLSALGIGSVTRLAGSNRYETCLEVTKAGGDLFTGNGIVLATGAAFPDALAGGALAAKLRVPLILAGTTELSTGMRSWLKAKDPLRIYVMGGSGAISDWSMYLYTA